MVVGRRGELARIGRTLEAARALTLTGLPGVGKTVLARAALAGLDAYRVDLATLRDGDLLPFTVAYTLRIPDDWARSVPDLLVEALAPHSVLLVLDNCEHLASACAELLDFLLPACPRLRIIATSRSPLGTAAAETVLEVPPLRPDDAVALFAHEARTNFTLTPDNRETVATVCRRLDHVPLAIKLAAGALGRLGGLDRLAAEVARGPVTGLHVLTGGPAAPPRHRSMWTAIGWSHELSSPRERLLWARLSVFDGPFDVSAAERVCGDDLVPDVPAVLARLAAGSLLLRDHGYRMPAMIRAYGLAMLTELGERDTMERRHRLWSGGCTGG
jgi:predicted ATPase